MRWSSLAPWRQRLFSESPSISVTRTNSRADPTTQKNAWNSVMEARLHRRFRVKETHSLRVISLFFFLLATRLSADTDVTSREQFGRLLPGGLPNPLRYNEDRAWLELRTDDKNCPSSAHGFFELKINSQGEVTGARDVSTSRSVSPRALTIRWVRNILMQIRFRPLNRGGKTTSVHTFATVVCQ